MSGIGISVTAPQITLFLVRVLHMSDTVAGLYFLTNLAAPVAGYALGSLSDRLGSRLLVFRLSALAGFAGWTLMAVATQTWMPFAINIVLLGAAGAGAAQLQAAVRDELTVNPTPVDNQVVALIRMAMAIGWIVGPVFGAVAGAVWGLRPLLLGTGLTMLLSILPTLGVGPGATPPSSPQSPDRQPVLPAAERGRMTPLFVFTGIYVLIMCGETVKLAYLPLYMDGPLRLAAGLRGAVIGFQPLVEVALMPVAAKLADRFGIRPVLFAGAAMAVAAHCCYAAADLFPAPVGALIVGQFLMAGVIATFGVLGITVAQRLAPSRVGMASSVFLSAFAVNAAVGGFVGSLGTAWLGVPHLFWISAAIAAMGAAGLVVFDRYRPPGWAG